MLARPPRTWCLRAATGLSVAAAMLGSHLTPTGSADLRGQLSAAKSAAANFQAQVNAETREIQTTDRGLTEAQRRLTDLQTTLDRRVNELRVVQGSLIDARNHLITLEDRLQLATQALSANLVARYEGAKPDLMTVVLGSHGFGQLLDQVAFMRRAGSQDASIVDFTRTARTQVSREADRLGGLEIRDRRLANQVLGERNSVAALQTALEQRQVTEEGERARASGHYTAARGRIGSLQRRIDAQERAAEIAAEKAVVSGNAGVGGIAVDTTGIVQPPAGAPAAVRQMIAAGNAIATLPYVWGGGHGSFQADGYDCSGSTSYVLAAAGLLSAPEVSGDFESYGEAGPGRWVTIYANAGHVWMEIAGRRFDTVALAENGSRWSEGGGEFAGFVVRHPPGL